MAGRQRRGGRGNRPGSNSESVERLRQHISAEAARIMAEEGVADFHVAKRRAAARLNLPETKHLPSNLEIESALQQYLQLFHAESSAMRLRHFRQIASEAMRFFERFEPRLVGAVLSGTVTSASEIQLHVTADTPEEVGLLLFEHRIPYEHADRRLRFGGDRYETVPAVRFAADSVAVELCIFSPRNVREIPLSPVDGRPMRRANLKEVEALLDEGLGVAEGPEAD